MEMTDIAKLLMVVYDKVKEPDQNSYENRMSRVGGDDNSVCVTNTSSDVIRGVFANEGDVSITVHGDLIVIKDSEVHLHL